MTMHILCVLYFIPRNIYRDDNAHIMCTVFIPRNIYQNDNAHIMCTVFHPTQHISK